MSPPPFLPYGRQWIDDDDVAAVTAVLRGDWLTQGPAVEAFEQAVAAAASDPASGAAPLHTVACANGTAALHLAFLALDLQPGDAVVVPAITFLATASAVRHAGGEVAFADVDPATGLLTPDAAAAAIDRAQAAGWRVRALAPVHYAGQTAGLPGLAALAAATGAVLVEDACHALGSVDIREDGRAEPVGGCAHSAMTAFSFHPVKTAATGEGGAVTTRDAGLARRLRRLRNHGMIREAEDFVSPGDAFTGGDANPWYYEMAEPGFNYRLTDIQAALGVSQLRRLPDFVDRRRRLTAQYARRLAPFAPAVEPLATVPWSRPAWHLCALRIDFAGLDRPRAAVMAELRRRGVGSQVHYIPVHQQPYWRRRYGPLVLPGAESFYRRQLSVPLFPAMADDDVDRVVDELVAVLGLRHMA